MTLFILDYELEGTDHYGGMPWQNCHGYLFLLLILLIVALIVAAQLLWQYFLPSRLVAALDHKRHLPPNTNTLPLTYYFFTLSALTFLIKGVFILLVVNGLHINISINNCINVLPASLIEVKTAGKC